VGSVDSWFLGGIMITQRPRLGNRLTGASKPQSSVGNFPARLFPSQNKIRYLENELQAFNQRITELEGEGHRGHAVEVLKTNAIDLARQVDAS
jgi:hypothetical protein